MRILIYIAAPHIVVGKVAAHEIVFFCRRSTNASGFLHGREVEPLVVVFPYFVVIPSKEPRPFYISRVKEEHHRFTVFLPLSYVNGVGDKFAFSHTTTLINQLHGHLRLTCISIGSIFHLLGYLAPGLCQGTTYGKHRGNA